MEKFAIIVEPRAEPNDTYVIAAFNSKEKAQLAMRAHAWDALKLKFKFSEVDGSDTIETDTHLLRIVPLRNYAG